MRLNKSGYIVPFWNDVCQTKTLWKYWSSVQKWSYKPWIFRSYVGLLEDRMVCKVVTIKPPKLRFATLQTRIHHKMSDPWDPCLNIYIYIYICMYVCMYVRICTNKHVYIWTYVYIHLYIHACIHNKTNFITLHYITSQNITLICVYIYIYIHIIIHTYTYLHLHVHVHTLDILATKWSKISPRAGIVPGPFCRCFLISGKTQPKTSRVLTNMTKQTIRDPPKFSLI